MTADLDPRFTSPGAAISAQQSDEDALDAALVKHATVMLATVKQHALSSSLTPAKAAGLWSATVAAAIADCGIVEPAARAFLTEALEQENIGDEAYASAMAVIRKAQATYPAPSQEDIDKALDEALDLTTPSLEASASANPSQIIQKLRKVGGSWRNRLRRTVRTAYTGFTGYLTVKALQAALIPNKQWVAHHDDRTRPTHLAADGQTVPTHVPFVVGGERLMYPGDRQGSPEETYFCRCVVIAVD